MYDYHLGLTIVAIGLGVVGAVLYIRSILNGKTKPHIFTWIAYLLIDSTVFTVQLLHGGGLGSGVLLLSVLGIAVICVVGFKYREKKITTLDRVSFSGAILGIVLWMITSNPLLAVIIATITNTLGVVPTFRKSYSKPFEESISLWGLDVFKFALGIFALSTISATTALFPIGIVLTNASLVAMILIRRYQLKV